MTGVEPATSPRGATLDITVTGAGFDSGSVVGLERAGEPAGSIQTNSTSYVSPTTLIANISIGVNADTGKYDIVVLTTYKRKGVGIELFDVRYELIDVGVIGGTWSLATGINDAGQVVGSSCTQDCLAHAFVWSEGRGLEDLGTLPGFSRSSAVAINNRGQVLGSVFCYPNDPGCQAGSGGSVLWERSDGRWAIRRLGIPAGSEGDINNTGWIVAGGRLYELSPATAVESGMIFDIPAHQGGQVVPEAREVILPSPGPSLQRVVVQSINDAGLVVGQSWPADASLSAVPVMWFGDWSGQWRVRPLGLPPGVQFSLVRAVSEVDVIGRVRVLGNVRESPRSGPNRPVRWTVERDATGAWSVTSIDLLEMPSGAALTVGALAWGINTAGAVVGEYTYRGEGGYGYLEAVLWLPTGEVATLLPAPLRGLARARAISNDGRVIGSIWDNAQACERAAYWRPRS